jgi:purine-nucleoside phosphorylase
MHASSFTSPAELLRKIKETTEYIKSYTDLQPEFGIILGTGLSGIAREIQAECILEYKDIPHFPISTVESHPGRLIIGRLSGHMVLAMQGRFHYYEGYTMQQITFPVRVMKALGINTLIISNACGALNPLFRRSDIMLIDDHINLLGDNPLIGPNADELGPRFPDMSRPYDPELGALAERLALEMGIKLQKGVYVAVAGPNLETRAEYRFLRWAGADVVGMSTVPENIVARHMGMRVAGFSIITDECFPDALQPVTLQEVIEAAHHAEPQLTRLILALIAQA